MKMYELTLLLEKEDDLKPIKELITQYSGKILTEEKWGQRLLSYPIKKKNKAIYYILDFSLDKKNILPLKTKLNFNERIIRYLLLVKEK